MRPSKTILIRFLKQFWYLLARNRDLCNVRTDFLEMDDKTLSRCFCKSKINGTQVLKPKKGK